MAEEFEVRWDGVLPGTPQQVWDAITARTAAWVWDISFEPWAGGAEKGLTPSGGTVTAWDPPRHFETLAERPDGWRNSLEYDLAPQGEGTLLNYRHSGVWLADYEKSYDACVQHTKLYYQTLGEYLRHFEGIDPVYESIEVPGAFKDVLRRLGLSENSTIGDELSLKRNGGEPAKGTIDYLTPVFLGIRTDDSLVRIFGRETWGGGVSASLHLFHPVGGVERTTGEWSDLLGTTNGMVA